MRIIIICLLALFIHAKESHYQIPFCQNMGGKIEYTLPDRSRVDCLTDEYAIEVDYAKKWAESIGQSMYYSLMTKRKPAVAIIMGHGDIRRMKRLYKVTEKLNIRVFIIRK